MLNYLKNIFSTKAIKHIENIDEKATRISNAFAKLIKEKYDFNTVLIGIDKTDNITSNSVIYQALVVKGEMSFDSDFEIKNRFLKYGDNLSPSKRLITFKMIRHYNDLSENQYMFAMVTNETYDLFFLNDYNDGIFGHYTVTETFRDFGYFKNFSFYSYSPITDKLSYCIDIPLNIEGDKLSLKESRGDFFTKYRTYMVRVSIAIDNQLFSKKANIQILFNAETIKSVECEIASHKDFEDQVLKIIFPFNLSNQELDDLHIEKLSLKDLGLSFDSHYEVYEMSKI
jgi:hypothetical protein